jgi:predicted NUDIX family phosphoesterase/thymidylate kinase
MVSQIEVEVAKLEAEAVELRELLKYAPRAFVIEFAGTPKSGKSTSVEAIRHFFTRQGFRVHVLAERAAVCPIPMKGHLFFNTWCAATMLAELLANVETETDLIIVDRGLFDALVWLALQEKRGELTADEARTIEGFLLMKRWRSLVDLAIVMNVSAEEALDRETANRITRKSGSIMNPDVLKAVTESVDEAVDRYGPKFHALIRHHTTAKDPRQSNIELAQKVFASLRAFLNPQVLVVPKKEIEGLPWNKGGAFGPTAVADAVKCIKTYGQFIERVKAEADAGYVQIIPCGLLSYKEQVFLFQRKEADPKYRLYGKATIWQGSHVSKRNGLSIPDLLKVTLQERISRALFVSRVFRTESLGYCWDRDDPGSSQHFGLVHRIEIDNPHTAVDLKQKEFRKKRGHGMLGKFVDLQDLQGKGQDELSLESWSRTILDHIINTNE